MGLMYVSARLAVVVECPHQEEGHHVGEGHHVEANQPRCGGALARG